jgi:hypothetical protein
LAENSKKYHSAKKTFLKEHVKKTETSKRFFFILTWKLEPTHFVKNIFILSRDSVPLKTSQPVKIAAESVPLCTVYMYF